MIVRRPRLSLHPALAAIPLILSGCGGGGGGGGSSTVGGSDAVTTPVPVASAVNIDTTVNVVGGGGPTQTSRVDATFDGPAVVLSAAAQLQVCVSGTWMQQLRSSGTIALFTTSVLPVPLASRAGTAVDAFGPTTPTLISLPYLQCDTHALPAGTYALRYQVRAECAAGCLSAFSADLRWRVQTVN